MFFSRHVSGLARTLTLAVALVSTNFTLMAPSSQAAVDPGQNSEIDYAISFSSAVGTVPSTSPVIPANDSTFTVEGWFYLNPWVNDGDNYLALFSQNQEKSGCMVGSNLQNRLFVSVHYSGSAYELHTGQNTCGQSYFAGSVPEQQWAHIAYVSAGNDGYKTYINGELVYANTTPVTAVGSDLTGFNIGAVALSTSPSTTDHEFDGKLDQIKIWDSALTKLQIQTSMHKKGDPSIGGLLHEYDFNEGSGNTIYDRVGSADLTVTGAHEFNDVKSSISQPDGTTLIAFPRTYLPGIGGWRIPEGVSSLELLAVAGGGGGGAWVGGGGGAGGFYENTQYSVEGNQIVGLQVGQGGNGAQYKYTGSIYPNASGQSTKFGDFEVPGGGAGANYNSGLTTLAAPGGSGGGGTTVVENQALFTSGYANPGAATASGAFGFPGGKGSDYTSANTGGVYSAQPHPTGGGGGAGGAGGDATGSTSATAYSGAGGPGTSSQILSGAQATALGIGEVSGASAYFSGGGGGGIHGRASASLVRSATAGGTGGGGAGNSFNTSYPDSSFASPAVFNTGGGGGGSGNDATKLSVGGAGGSGVVVVRIPVDDRIDYAASLSAASSNGYYLPADGGTGDLSLTNDFSVEMWTKIESLPASGAYSMLFNKENSYELLIDSNGYFNYGLQLDSGGTWGLTPTSISAPVGSWFHIGFTKASSGGAVRLTLNGVQVLSTDYSYNHPNVSVSALTSLLASNSVFTLGGRSASQNTPSEQYLNGQIDEVRIWSTPRTSAEIAAQMHQRVSTSSPGLVAYWDFNDGSSSTASDLVGSNDLTGHNAPGFQDVKTSTSEASGDLLITFPRSYLPRSGGWTAPAGVTKVSALIIAGGGAGGAPQDNSGWYGGGGGAGGYQELSSVTVASNTPYVIKVGQGGVGGVSTAQYRFDQRNYFSTPGQDSSFGAWSTPSFGGGFGGQLSQLSSQTRLGAGGSGGSGGGGLMRTNSQDANSGSVPGGSGVAGQGFAGGTGAPYVNSNASYASGGGGGAGGAGGNAASSPARGGNAGAGTQSSQVLKTSSYLATGGAGGGYNSNHGTAATGGASAGQSGTANTGGGGGGGGQNTLRAGSGGSGLIALRISRNVSIEVPDGFRGGSVSLSGTVSAAAGQYVLSIDATSGSMSIGNLPTGVSANTGTTNVGLLSLVGQPSALDLAMKSINYTYAQSDGNFTISATLMPVITDSATRVQDPMTGHIYVASISSAAFSAHKSYAESQYEFGTQGYLANITSARENAFLTASPTAFLTSGLTIGLSDADQNGLRSATWSWITGPAAGQAVTIGHVGETPGRADIAGIYSNWNTGEPNGNTTDTTPNCAVTNWTAAGVWDDSACTSSGGSLIEFGGLSTDPGFAQVSFNVEQQFVDIEFTEIDFDYSDHTNITSRNSVGDCTGSSDCIGKALNDKVLFNSVSTRNGVTIDALVTTKTLYNTVISKYEVGASAGGQNSHFQVDAKMTTTGGGYAEFQFEFFIHGTYPSNPVQVRLKNVNVSLIDIDYYQYNDVTDIQGFTVASGTNLKTCMSASPVTSCTANTAASVNDPLLSSGTNFTRFQGRSGFATNDPKDMAIANYGSIESFSVKLGTTKNSTNDNLYGVAFVALPWGSATPATTGVQYTLNYSGNGNTSGTTASAVTGAVGTNITLASAGTLAKTGYTFGGWNTKADGTGTSYASAASYQMPNGGATLYAVWVPTLYTLTYNANGGAAAPSSGTYGAGSTVTIASGVPSRVGYTFTHWAAASNGTGATYSAGSTLTMPAANTTVYAQWQVAQGTLLYYANGGTTTQPSLSATAGSSVTVASGVLTSRTGYTFTGWNTAANGSGTDYAAASSITLPVGTTSLYAQWTRNIYAVNYLANGGTGAPSSVNKYALDVFNLSSTAPTRTGYTFAGWNTAANGSSNSFTAGQSVTMSASNLVLYAQWTANSYTISYDVNGGAAGTEPASHSEVAYSTATIASGVPTKTGFKFNGWNTAANGSGSSYATGSSIVMPASNLTLYAQWVDNSFDIIYNPNGGVGGPAPSSSSGNVQISVSTTLPTRTGYTFTGWNLRSNGTGSTYSAGANYTVTGDTYFYAQWSPILYNIYYNANDGTGAPSTQSGLVVSQSAQVSSTVPTRTGYSFGGWAQSTASGATPYSGGSTFQMPAADVTLYAKWTGLPFTLLYNANGGSGSPSNETLNAGSTTLVGSAPTRTGYTFAGWNVLANGSSTSYSVNGLLTMPGSNLTLYAQWSPVTKNIIFNGNGGTGSPSQFSATYSSTVTIPGTVPTRTGYTFLGWNTLCDGTGTAYQPGDAFTMGANDVNLCAQWQAITYQLTYDANGGSNPPAGLTAAASEVVSVSATLPTRLGFTFGSWNTAANGSGNRYLSATNLTMPSSNVTLYAIWSADPSTIYYNANGGSGAPSAQPGRTGDSTNVSGTVPTRPGFRFINWNTQLDGSGTSYSSSASITLPAGSVTLYAQWEYLTYTLTYNANGGSGAPTALSGLTVSETVNLSGTSPSRTGYKFLGWNSAANGSGTSYVTGSAFVMPAANVTLYAKWISSEYRFIYHPNGGTNEPAAATYSNGVTFSISSQVPSRSGYSFQHWDTNAGGTGTAYNPDDDFTMGASDVTLYAIWGAKSVSISYNINGGTGTTPTTQVMSYSDPVQLAGSTAFSKSGGVFLGWNTRQDGTGTQYTGEQLTTAPEDDLLLYAQWSAIYYVLEYNPTGGSGEPADALATSGQTIVVPTTTPAKSGYVFDEWTNVTSTVTYTPGTTITMPSSNVMLFAVWSTPTPTSGGGGIIIVAPAPTVSPTASPTVSPTVSDPVVTPDPGDQTPTGPGTKPGTGGSSGINFNDYVNAKVEEYDPDTFDNWVSSESTVVEPATPESAPGETATAAPTDSDSQPQGSNLPWLIGGFGAVLAAAGGLIFAARRRDRN